MDLSVLEKTISEFVFMQLARELSKLGHNLTGSLIASFETKIRDRKENLTIDFLMNSYGLSINYGIKPANIPYTVPPPFRGGTSKYIQGLINFAKIKFHADERTAKNIAFAIAAKHKKYGFPLSGKIGFFDNVLEADSDLIEEIIQEYFEATLIELFKQYIDFKNYE